jgi:DNA-directed RNA polymerase subunit RPC12/RpoP
VRPHQFWYVPSRQRVSRTLLGHGSLKTFADGSMVLLRWLNPKCRRCGKRRLTSRQFVRATVVRDGRRAPDAWTYYQCGSCGKRWKHSPWTKIWDDVSDGEWDQTVIRGTEP